VLTPITLDPVTVADDDRYLPGLAAQRNLAAALTTALEWIYR
jgi:hypothetical protein